MRTTAIITGIAAAVLNYGGYLSLRLELAGAPVHGMLLGMAINSALVGALVGGLTWSLMWARHLQGQTVEMLAQDRQVILGKQQYLNFEMRQSMHGLVCALGTVPNVDSRIWDAINQVDREIKQHTQLIERAVLPPGLPPAPSRSWATSAVVRLFVPKRMMV